MEAAPALQCCTAARARYVGESTCWWTKWASFIPFFPPLFIHSFIHPTHATGIALDMGAMMSNAGMFLPLQSSQVVSRARPTSRTGLYVLGYLGWRKESTGAGPVWDLTEGEDSLSWSINFELKSWGGIHRRQRTPEGREEFLCLKSISQNVYFSYCIILKSKNSY